MQQNLRSKDSGHAANDCSRFTFPLVHPKSSGILAILRNAIRIALSESGPRTVISPPGVGRRFSSWIRFSARCNAGTALLALDPIMPSDAAASSPNSITVARREVRLSQRNGRPADALSRQFGLPTIHHRSRACAIHSATYARMPSCEITGAPDFCVLSLRSFRRLTFDGLSPRAGKQAKAQTKACP